MAVTALSIAGCGPSGLGPWQEEVRLSDGREIVVERYEESDVRQPIGDVGAAFLTNTTLKVLEPTQLASLPMLSTQYRQLILDFDAALGTWFVFAFDERACMYPRAEAIREGRFNATGRINLRPNVEYRLQESQWVQWPVSAERFGLPSNLLMRRISVEHWMDQQRPVPLAEKLRLDSDNGLPAYLRQVESRVSC